jgi:arginyl-tRNA synthetase
MNIKETIKQLINDALANCAQSGLLSHSQPPPFVVETPKMQDHGDYATNVAMLLAPQEKKAPRKIAQDILEHIPKNDDIIEKLEIAGPGFINFFVTRPCWLKAFKEISLQGNSYGRSQLGQGKKINLEYVSANPTGPLHIGHGRGAALGDALANILNTTGFKVTREYYINDTGNQMETLGKSVYTRYLQLLGKDVDFPPDFYQGDYIEEIAQQIVSQQGNHYEKTPESESVPFFTSFAVDNILKGIQKDLEDFGAHFDNWFSEKTLHKEKAVEKAINELKEKGHTFEEEGHLWFKSTQFGDDKDRVVIRNSGVPTYFASDCAYHRNKLERKFDRIINIWGADHHGYIPRIKAVIEAYGNSRDAVEVLLVQFVNLLRDGAPVAMSTRSGKFVTLREVIDEVGNDAVKYTFLTRKSDAHLDFDLEVAKKQSDENPVYYVQYAHARICNIINFAKEQGVALPDPDEVNLELLLLPEELNLIKQLSSYPEMVEACALNLEPHRVTIYLNELVSNFHRYYHRGKLEGKHRVVTEDVETSKSRLWLANTIRIVIKNGLELLGVTAPERM